MKPIRIFDPSRIPKNIYRVRIEFTTGTTYHQRATDCAKVYKDMNAEHKNNKKFKILGSTVHMDATDQRGINPWSAEQLVNCLYMQIFYTK